jgi:ATP-binding cassette subfamily B multidrug efflux pump
VGPVNAWTYLGRYRARLITGSALLLATNGLALAIPYLLGRTIDALRGADPAGEVPRLAMWMIGLAAAQAVARIGSRILLFNAARMAEADLRSALFAHLMKLEPSYYRSHPVGDVMSRLTSDVQTVRAMWGPGILNLVNTTMLFGAALFLMLGIDPWLTLWALLPYPLVVALGSLYGRRIYRSSRAVQEEMGSLSTALQEDLGGIAIIKTYTLEEERGKVFEHRSGRLRDKNMDLTRVRGQLMPLLGGVASLGTVIVLFAGGKAVISHRIDLGQMVQMSGYLALLVWPTLALGWMISLLQRGQASWRRLTEVLERRPAIADSPGALRLEAVRGDVSLRGLTIEIDGKRLVEDVTLEIPAGTVTAIVGRLGSGKSLLVEAIPRLIDIPPGTVLLDGHDICELELATLRGAIGYAPQEAFLFSTTIAENIAVGLEGRRDVVGDEAVAAAVRQAALEAGLERDLAALPDGLETIVGERGVTLSGGQRQRVALARALVSRPRVLILDDSLSSVDAETERQILEQLEAVMRGRTAILISHRVAAVRRAHQIAVLDGGKLVERGTHAELLARGGVYADLYRTQLEEEMAA